MKDKIIEYLASEEGQGLFADEAFKSILEPYVEEAKKPLLNKRDELLSEVQQLRQRKSFDEFGGYETVKEQLEAYKAMQQAKPDEKEVAQAASLREEIEKERAKLNSYRNKFIDATVRSEVSSVLTKHKGAPELLGSIISSRVQARLDDETGKIEYDVLTADGKPLFKNGEPATIEDLVIELKNDPIFARAFEGTGANGSGTKATQTGATTGSVITDMNDPNYSLTAHMDFIKRTRK